MSLLNVGARALLANQVALQTTGHNIANVSTAGYSRQSVAMQTVQGQFTGSGYIGNGVNVATILRNHNELLTRQAAAAQAVQAGDSVRAERLSQLQDVFQGGTSGLGAGHHRHAQLAGRRGGLAQRHHGAHRHAHGA
ncbi:flagellar hook-associated protein flgk [Alicycliphilus sp. B1]|nr:flagellar hook-associated protein flgk [Alicycliphilus sp. B1]